MISTKAVAVNAVMELAQVLWHLIAFSAFQIPKYLIIQKVVSAKRNGTEPGVNSI